MWRFHKPKGLVTTHKDEKGRTTVFENLPPDLPRVVSVGRLDINSEGLLLLTNDGALARALEHPSRGWVRRYRVRVHGRPDPKPLAKLKNGITVEGVRYGPIIAAIDETKEGAAKTGKRNVWLSMALSEGKNREVRKVLAHLGLSVTRLIRVSYGPFQLGKLEEGGVEEIAGQVVREQLGVARLRGPSTEAASGEAARRTAAESRAALAHHRRHLARPRHCGERRRRHPPDLRPHP